MPVNRFMKPIQGPRNQQYMELDYNQLAAGVLAREDAYDQNAAVIDSLDQDYIQGITGVEADRAKEINNNIETMVRTIGDKYNGDLSKAGDAIRNAKKYIRKTTGNDSEGALINANLKAYQADIKAIDAKEKWSKAEKDQAKQDALDKHNASTNESYSTDGKYSNYSARGIADYYDIQKLTMDAIGKIEKSTFQTAWGAVPTGKVDAQGNYEFLQSGTNKKITRTPQEILSLVPDVLANNPEATNYLNEAAYLNTRGIPQSTFDDLAEEQALKVSDLAEKQADGDIEGIQKVLISEGYLTEADAKGGDGPKTQAAIIEYSKSLDETFDSEWAQDQYKQERIGGLGRQGVKQFTVNDEIRTIQYKAGAAYEDARKAQATKLAEANTIAGSLGGSFGDFDYNNLSESKKATSSALAEQKPSIEKMLTTYGYGVDKSLPEGYSGPTEPMTTNEVFNGVERMLRMSDEEIIKNFGSPGQTVTEVKNSKNYKLAMDNLNSFRSLKINEIQLNNSVRTSLENTSAIEERFNSIINKEFQNDPLAEYSNAKINDYLKTNKEKYIRIAEEVIAGGGSTKHFNEKVEEEGLKYITGDFFATASRNSKKLNKQLQKEDYVKEIQGIKFINTAISGDKSNAYQTETVNAFNSFLVTDVNGKEVNQSELLSGITIIDPTTGKERQAKKSDITSTAFSGLLGTGIAHYTFSDGSTTMVKSKKATPVLRRAVVDAVNNPSNVSSSEEINLYTLFGIDATTYIDNKTTKASMDETGLGKFTWRGKQLAFRVPEGDTTGAFDIVEIVGDTEIPLEVEVQKIDGTIVKYATDPSYIDMDLAKQHLSKISAAIN